MIPVVSVIIPVYGVEDYIAKSMQSLLDQTFTDFEAIIVNDGTLDNSIEVAKSVVKDDPRFIFLEKENGGQSSARNMGLDHARGKFISFLDPDDAYSPLFLKETISLITQKFDIVVTGLNYISTKGKVTKTFIPNIDMYYQKKDYLLGLNSINYSVCNKLFTKDIFNKKRFTENIIYEDREILPHLLYKRKIIGTSKKLYDYIARPDSTVHRYNENYLNSYFFTMKSHKELLLKNSVFEEYSEIYEYAYIDKFFLPMIIYLAKYSPNYTQDLNILKSKLDMNIINTEKIFYYYANYPTRKWGSLLFLQFPKIFRFFYRIKEFFK